MHIFVTYVDTGGCDTASGHGNLTCIRFDLDTLCDRSFELSLLALANRKNEKTETHGLG
jgi:hypothetical protein